VTPAASPAGLARYIDYWEQHAAAKGYQNHPAEQLDDIRHRSAN